MQWFLWRSSLWFAAVTLFLASCDSTAGATNPAAEDGADGGVDGADTEVALDTASEADAERDGEAVDAAQDTRAGEDTAAADSPDASAGDTAGHDAGEDTKTGPGLQLCVGTAFDPGAAGDFRHTSSDLLVAISHPEHSAQDVIGHPGEAQVVPGKFAYGRFSKDLEDEDIDVYVNNCAGWQYVGRSTTNGDGRTSTALDPATYGLGTGVYDLRQVVLGDASVNPSALRLLPAGTKLVVFDIDGTLTTSDSEVFTDAIDEFFVPLYDGSYVPEKYPSAVEITQLLASKGYVIIYLTGRPYWLTGITRQWLDQLGFAPGHVHLTDSNAEALPTEGGTGAYKRDYLRFLQSLGYEIVYAYGNASTDIFAYSEASIPADHTWIIGDNGGDGGTQAISGGYTDHLTTAAGFPAAQQPY